MAQHLTPLGYQSGFVNEFATEARPGALPEGQNAPHHAPLGLYIAPMGATAVLQLLYTESTMISGFFLRTYPLIVIVCLQQIRAAAKENRAT